jgi:hypothetical protein
MFKIMYYTIYKTVNVLNKKFYIGYHKTENINDDYLGSGKLLLEAIEKYGKENFKKEILYIFPTKYEALLKEVEIVDENFINRKDTYNFKLGGEGGWDHIPSMIKKDKEFRKKMYKNVSKGVKIAHKEGRLKGWHGYTSGFKGKHHSPKTKKRISEKQKLSKEIIEKRLNIIFNNNEFGWGWKHKVAKKMGIPHQHLKGFLDTYLIGTNVTIQDNTLIEEIPGGKMTNKTTPYDAVVIGFSSSKDTDYVLGIDVEYDFNGKKYKKTIFNISEIKGFRYNNQNS